jgi:hypothetical protein
MKLISKIHDYYDGVIRTTKQDESILFLREQRNIHINHGKFLDIEHRDDKNDYHFKLGVIGFCGMLFPFVEVEEQSRSDGMTKESVYLDKDSIIADFKGLKNVEKHLWGGVSSLSNRITHWLTAGEERGWGNNLYSIYRDNILKELFLKERIAYFAIRAPRGNYKGYNVEVYPILKDLMFFKKFDAFTAYQTIEMFLSNEMVQHDNRKVVISDKLKAESKGFDKWSFRKMPED